MGKRFLRLKAAGMTVVLVVGFVGSLPHVSAAGGTWGVIGSSLGEQDFAAVASSTSGRYLAVAATNGSIYTSSTYGASWVERTGAGVDGWSSITVSEDGSKLAVVPRGGRAWTSEDYGATWEERVNVDTRYWNYIAGSADGNTLIISSDASGALGEVAFSHDGGDTWESVDTGDFGPVAVNADGQYLAYVESNKLFVSANGGTSWTEALSASGIVSGVDYSADGSRIVALDQDVVKVKDFDAVGWDSTNLGVTQLRSVAMDDSGENIAVASWNDGVYTSEDSGDAWEQGDESEGLELTAIASDGSGERLIAAGMQRIWVNEGPLELEDYNGDDIPDLDQSQLSAYTNAYSGKIVAIDVGEDCEITSDDSIDENSLGVQDAGYEYESGLFDFEADCSVPTTTITLYYYDVSLADQVIRKFNPSDDTYFTVTDEHGAVIEERVIDGHTVVVASYEVTDGGVLDQDGAVNGTIVDPAGLAAPLGVPSTGLGRLDR